VGLAIGVELATLVPVTALLGAVLDTLAAGLAMEADTRSQAAVDMHLLAAVDMHLLAGVAVVAASTVVGAASAAADMVAAVVDTGNRT
jgi:hypothetical protein